MLRLLSSDLILDEPDDFGLTDLPALCRLIHWSAMLGSRVVLSTATMPPALVYACFEAYKSGWQAFVKANIDDWNGAIQCAWFDEMQPSLESLEINIDDFKKTHNSFVKKRVEQLEKLPPKRLGKVVIVKEDSNKMLTNNSVTNNISQTIYNSIHELHTNHYLSKDDKTISIGLVRMANIDPIVAVAKSLLDMDAPADTCIHYCVYHSRYALAIRSHLEEQLDHILKRKDNKRIWDSDDGLGNIINSHKEKHHIFVVIASPVAEVGRDHDYDWAIIEPSSMRSIIQIAGRVLRHRDIQPQSPNIYVLNKNIKALSHKEVCFTRPGFESKHAIIEDDKLISHLTLSSHQLNDSLTDKLTDKKLNSIMREGEIDIISAIPRISLFPFERVPIENLSSNRNKPSKQHVQYKHLTALEHVALFETLSRGAQPANVWWYSHPHWCGEVQRQQRFRNSKNDISYRLYFADQYSNMTFKCMNTDTRPPELGEPLDKFIPDEWQPKGHNSEFWFDLNPLDIYQRRSDDFNLSLDKISVQFGEFRVTRYGDKQSTFFYHDHLGIYSKR